MTQEILRELNDHISGPRSPEPKSSRAGIYDEATENLVGAVRGLRSILTPPPLITVDEWADQNRVLSRETTSTGGAYRVSTVEVARGPMRAVTEYGVKKITVMSATQLMKTNILENVIGYFVAVDPSPILMLQPKEDFSDAFNKEKLVPMIRNTPCLLEAFGGAEAFAGRNTDNTLRFKRFRGGFIANTSAGSPTNVAMRAIRAVLADEIDKYEDSREGDVLVLAEERTETFSHNSILIQVCSPTVKGGSRIERQYEMSDQRRAYVTCPHCGHQDHMRWKDVHWDKDTSGAGIPSTAAYLCPNPDCRLPWSEKDRVRILTTPFAVVWRQTRKFSCCDKTQDPQETRLWDVEGRALCSECGRQAVSNEHAGFTASFLYSPWKPLAKDVAKFLLAKGHRPSLRAFVNTRLAETFEDDKELEAVEMDEQSLAGRREPPWGRVPEAVKIITAGVDVQGDRLEAEIVGWGDGEESWSLGYHKIEGDPSGDEPWRELDRLLLKPLPAHDGTPMFVRAACIDSGGNHTQQVYSFCSARKGRLVMPIKGGQETSGVRSPIFPTAKVIPIGKPYILGTNTAKDRIESMMRVLTPGPGYMHVPGDREEQWFKMITAEKRQVFFVHGQRRTRWVPKYQGIRNEALDCRVYALAALEMLRKFKVITARTLMPTGVALPETGTANAAPDSVAATHPGTATQKPAKRPRSGTPPGARRPQSPFGGGGGFGGFGGRR